MSRHITFSVTYNNNRTSCIAGLYNGNNAELYTSHFNHNQFEMFKDTLFGFFMEKKSKKIKKSCIFIYASTGSSRDNSLNNRQEFDKIPSYKEVREIFDTVNSYKG